jgi:hypothetical protein
MTDPMIDGVLTVRYGRADPGAGSRVGPVL